MAMAAIGIATATIGTVIVAIRKAKTALGALATGTIAMGIPAVLVSIKGSRYQFNRYCRTLILNPYFVLMSDVSVGIK